MFILALWVATSATPTATTDSLLARLERPKSTVDAAMALAQLWEARREQDVAPSLERAAAATKKHPLLAPLRMHASYYAELAAPLGEGAVHLPSNTPDEVLVAGPFANEERSGCSTAFAPESQPFDAQAQFEGKERLVHWRPLRANREDGVLALDEVVWPPQEGVSYVRAAIRTDAQSTIRVGAGVAGAFQLWIDGNAVLDKNWYSALTVAQRQAEVALSPGLHQVLLKVCHDRLRPVALLQVEGATFVGPKEIAAGSVTQVAPIASPAERILAEVEGWRSAAGARQLAEAAWVLDILQGTPDADKVPMHLAEAAVSLARDARAGQVQALAARVSGLDANMRRGWLQVAAKTGDERSIVSLAYDELEHQRLQAAAGWIGKLKGRDSSRIARLRADYAGAILDVPGYLKALENGAGQFKEDLTLCNRYARELIGAGRAKEALRVQCNARRYSPDWLSDQAAIAEEVGATELALKQLRRLQQLRPSDTALGIAVAAHCLRTKICEVDAAWLEQHATSSDNPEWMVKAARILFNIGKKDQAELLVQQALRIRPTSDVRELLAVMSGAAAPDLRSEAIELAEIIRLASEPAPTAESVVLVDSSTIRVRENGTTSRFVQRTVQYLSKSAVQNARAFNVGYSPDRQDVRLVMCRVIRRSGEVVEGCRERESGANDPLIGMYYDVRIRSFVPAQIEVGDVFDMQYVLEDVSTNNLLADYFGEFSLVQEYDPKRRYRLNVELPMKRTLYFNEKTLPEQIAFAKAAVTSAQGEKFMRYQFEGKDILPIAPEGGTPGLSNIADHIQLSTYKRWQDVGDFYWSLVKEQLNPDAQVKALAQRLVQGVPNDDTNEKVRRIYEYVVSETRYVALEFGIHSFKPYSVDRILKRGFGDCKDKASLIVALCKEVGVEANLVLLRMKSKGTLPDFPPTLSGFNHAIAYVPALNLYLDGTAQYHGIDELPGEDREASVLIVHPNGKHQFTQTPMRTAEGSGTAMAFQIEVDGAGRARIVGHQQSRGEYAPQVRAMYLSEATRRANFSRGIGAWFPGAQVTALTATGLDKLNIAPQLDFELEAESVGSMNGGRLTAPIFASKRALLELYAPQLTRKLPLELGSPWTLSWKVEWKTPSMTRCDSKLPEPRRIKSNFGVLESKYEQVEDRLVAAYDFKMLTSEVQPSDYAAFRAFLTDVDAVLGAQVAWCSPKS